MKYYASEECTYNGVNCKIDYNSSNIKHVVDAWSNSFNDKLYEVEGYKARLVKYEELVSGFKYRSIDSNNFPSPVIESETHAEEMRQFDLYWTMSPYYDYNDQLWTVSGGHIISSSVQVQGGTVRPVINVYKSAITKVN